MCNDEKTVIKIVLILLNTKKTFFFFTYAFTYSYIVMVEYYEISENHTKIFAELQILFIRLFKAKIIIFKTFVEIHKEELE